MIVRLTGLLTAFALVAGIGGGAGAQTPPPAGHKVKVTYQCRGLKVVAYYDKNRVAFVYGAKHYSLPYAPSADGARYLGSGLEWWEKGPNVTLSSVQPGSTNGSDVLATCAAVVTKSS